MVKLKGKIIFQITQKRSLFPLKVVQLKYLHDHNSLCVVLDICSESGLAFGFVENKNLCLITHNMTGSKW